MCHQDTSNHKEKVVLFVSQDTFRPHLEEFAKKSCPICVPGHIPTTFGRICRKVVLFVSQDTFRPHLEEFAEKLSYLCPRTQTDTFGTFAEKLSYLCAFGKFVLFVSQDTNRPHFEKLRKSCPTCVPGHKSTSFGNFTKQVVLFVSKDNTWTHFIFLHSVWLRRQLQPSYLFFTQHESCPNMCPRTTFVHIYQFRIYSPNFMLNRSKASPNGFNLFIYRHWLLLFQSMSFLSSITHFLLPIT